MKILLMSVILGLLTMNNDHTVTLKVKYIQTTYITDLDKLESNEVLRRILPTLAIWQWTASDAITSYGTEVYRNVVEQHIRSMNFVHLAGRRIIKKN